MSRWRRAPRPAAALPRSRDPEPDEQEGTYPLPEAQLDRFLLEIDVGYPDRVAERRILLETTGTEENRLRAMMATEALMAHSAWYGGCP